VDILAFESFEDRGQRHAALDLIAKFLGRDLALVDDSYIIPPGELPHGRLEAGMVEVEEAVLPSGDLVYVDVMQGLEKPLGGKDAGGDTSKAATTDYFGEIPADRISIGDSVLRFTADGKSRGKLGIHPLRAKNVAGSYDSVHQVLTIILFDVEPHARYINQEWRTDRPAFSGDAVNAYNDGPLAGGGQMGPFFELESVSPAAFLAPGGSQIHHHSVFHFMGSEAGLEGICRKVLGGGVALSWVFGLYNCAFWLFFAL
jgi:hypothetical protein